MYPNGGRISVLHIISGLGFGGAERMLQKLVLHSDATRFRHEVVSLREVGPIGEELLASGIPVIGLGFPSLAAGIGSLGAALKAIG
ncbi:MAG: hypothetical protein PHE55_21210, partial [Methylococcaceae bacterium]|nr:hypothetical protein [Methylococcaceae bacterium]